MRIDTFFMSCYEYVVNGELHIVASKIQNEIGTTSILATFFSNVMTAFPHLILNHIPVVGSLFCFFLLLYGMLRNNQEIQRVALWFLFIVGVITIPTYFTGEAAEESVEHLPGVSEYYIESHEAAAKVSLISAVVIAILSLIGLIVWRRNKIPRGFLTLILLCNLLNFGLMGYTAHLGGQIRHTEIHTNSHKGENAQKTTTQQEEQEEQENNTEENENNEKD